VKTVKDKLNTRVMEVEEEMRKCRESIESYKQKSPSEEEVWLQLCYVDANFKSYL